MSVQMDLFSDDVKKVMPITLKSEDNTATDRLFRIIYENSSRGYCFTEPSSGIPWIQHKDIEDRGDGLFVIRFRCPPNQINDVFFWEMANNVLKDMNSIPRFFHETKEENGIPYEECVWVIQEGDGLTTKEEEEPEIGECESTEEGLADRFDEAMANFV